ncbi:MAG: hypothetical protein WBP13_09605 [Methylophilaceae bacterium]
MEIILQIFFEFLIQIIGEILFEFGLHSFGEPFRRQPNPWLAALGYVLIGAVIGGISVIIFPNHLVHLKTYQLVNLIVTPIIAGVCMAAIGAWRVRHGQTFFRIDQFAYGYLFALVIAVIRFLFAT